METMIANPDLITGEDLYHHLGITNVDTPNWDPLDDEDEPGEDDPIEEINIDDEEPFDDDEDTDDFDLDQS